MACNKLLQAQVILVAIQLDNTQRSCIHVGDEVLYTRVSTTYTLSKWDSPRNTQTLFSNINIIHTLKMQEHKTTQIQSNIIYI